MPAGSLRDFTPYWETGTKKSSDRVDRIQFCFDKYGLLREFVGGGLTTIWTSDYSGQDATSLYLLDDGLFAMYTHDCLEVWSPKVQLQTRVYSACWPFDIVYYTYYYDFVAGRRVGGWAWWHSGIVC